VQAERGARWLVTAHHADDQAETVLLRLLRGSAPSGLAAIPRRGPRGLVRPLLAFTREELVAHARASGLRPVLDPANTDPRHTRSWLRTAVMPVIAARLGDAAREALLDAASHARAESRAWDAALDVLPGLDLRVENGACSVARSVLSGYDKVLAGRMLRAAARRAGWRIGPRAAARVVAFAAVASSGRRLDIAGGLVAEIAFDRLVIGKDATIPGPRSLSTDAGAARFGSFGIAWRREPAPERIERTSWTTWTRADAVAVRALEAGDRIAPLGGTGRRAATKLLMEARIARGDRAAWPVLVHEGEPFWIPGVCRGSALLPEPGALATRIDVTTG
jgi:tRNA(Ile)-lysidine synthase